MRNLRAFGLVETCLSLIIMGIILTISIRIFQGRIHTVRETLSTRILDELRSSVINFNKIHHKLPCPAKDKFGLSFQTCSGLTQGHVPFKTLGVSPDRWEKAGHITYIVNSNHCIHHSEESRKTRSLSSPGIGITLPSSASPENIEIIEQETQKSLFDTNYQKVAAVFISSKVQYLQSGARLVISQKDLKNILIILDQDLSLK